MAKKKFTIGDLIKRVQDEGKKKKGGVFELGLNGFTIVVKPDREDKNTNVEVKYDDTYSSDTIYGSIHDEDKEFAKVYAPDVSIANLPKWLERFRALADEFGFEMPNVCADDDTASELETVKNHRNTLQSRLDGVVGERDKLKNENREANGKLQVYERLLPASGSVTLTR